jgi:hypothetical protein
VQLCNDRIRYELASTRKIRLLSVSETIIVRLMNG